MSAFTVLGNSINNPLRDINALAQHLRRWCGTSPNERRIDGQRHNRGNRSPQVFFLHQRKIFKLHGDTKTKAVHVFLQNNQLVLNRTNADSVCLRLPSRPNRANGWYCYLCA